MSSPQFPPTSWTRIVIAGTYTRDRDKALSDFCKAYWAPVYAFIRWRSGCADSAYDRTQGFFTRMLARNDLGKVDRARGRKFRSWLLTCVKNYLKNEPNYDLIEDHNQVEPSHHSTPERLYDRALALSLLNTVVDKLRASYVAAGKEQLFDALKGYLSGDSARMSYEDVAASLGMDSAGAVKKAAFDLRARSRKMLRDEVANSMNVEGSSCKTAVDEEIRQLLASLYDEPI
jgi:hypothetical protein